MTPDNRALWELVHEWRRLSELLPTLSPVRIALCKNADELAAILERPVVVGVPDDVHKRLISIQVGGCTCDTKTHEVSYHSERCHYRLAVEIWERLNAAPETNESMARGKS